MNVAEARAEIEFKTSWNVGKGPLTVADVDQLVLLARQPDSDGNAPDLYSEWTTATTLAVGAHRVPNERNGLVYRVSAITSGITGATEPTWPLVIGQTVVDSGVTWTADAATTWAWTWDVNEAAAEGCERRARYLADNFDVKVSTLTANRFQTPQFWIDQANRLRGLGSGRGSGLASLGLRGVVYADSL